MAQTLDLKIRGLFTHPNPLSEVPDGALSEAKNLVIDKESVAESRRGLARYGSVLGSPPKQVFEFQDKVFVHQGTTVAYDSDGAGTMTTVSASVSEPETGVKIRAFEANKNLFFTSSTGIRKLDAYNGTLRSAGVPKALDFTAATSATSTWLATGKSVAYRIVWGYTDANNNLILGTPSQRLVFSNSSGVDKSVTLTVTIPSGITTSYIYQVYRSGTAASAATANDELQLVAEGSPVAGDITAKSITINDYCPESLRGAALYTNDGQEGISNSNDEPPFAKDACVYRQCAFYANVTSRHRYFVNLLAVDSSTGLRNNDTFTITPTGGAALTYTGKAAETIASHEFLVSAASAPSDKIELTAQSLVRCINQDTTNTSVYAYYVSQYSDLPGQILIEERSLGGSGFTVASSRGSVFDPVISSAQSSTNDNTPGRIAVSKFQQPEAVPAYSYINVGSARDPIKRVVALRDSVFVFKSEGIFRITGEDISSFRAQLFDNTAKILAPESAAPLNNEVYAFTDQGVVAVSDNGVRVVSRAIESTLVSLSSANFTNFSTATWALGYESERKYLLAVPTQTGDTYATQIFVYNAFTEAWTRWVMNRSCGHVLQTDGKLYMGDPSNMYLYKERKGLTRDDYADEQFSVNVVSTSGTTVTLDSVANAAVGRTLGQGARRSKITAVDTVGITVTVENSLPWAVGAALIYVPIDCDLTYIVNTAQNPGITKQFREATFFFNACNFSAVSLYFSSNFSSSEETFDIAPVGSDRTWGSFTWGSGTWGGGIGSAQAIRTLIPLEKQRAVWLKTRVRHKQAFGSFALTGASFQLNPMSEKFR